MNALPGSPSSRRSRPGRTSLSTCGLAGRCRTRSGRPGRRRQQQVVSALSAVPAQARVVVAGREDTTPYECDGLTAYREQALLVVALPENERSGAVGHPARPATSWGFPWCARGAGTGLSGGAMPHALGRDAVAGASLNRIVERRPAVLARGRGADRGAQPGDQRGGGPATACTTPPIPAARSPAPSAATWPRTPGGVHCLKYGLTLAQRDAACAVSPCEGEAVDVRLAAHSMRPGLDLLSGGRRQRGHAGRGHGSGGASLIAQAATGALHHGQLQGPSSRCR